MFILYGCIERFFREALGLRISQGAFVNWVNATKRNEEPAFERIRELVMQSAIVDFDETGMYCNKRLD